VAHDLLLPGVKEDIVHTESPDSSLEPMQRAPANVGTFERWGSLATGSALIAYGLSRRSLPGAWAAAAGTTLIYRGATGHCPFYSSLGMTSASHGTDTRVALAGNRGINVHESIRIRKPADELYRFWRRVENLPQFMRYLDRVTDLGNGRSHWVAKGPAGATVEWDADVINQVENKLIAWRSLPDSQIVTAGSVRFEPVRDGRETQISVRLQYSPPAGKLGKVFAMLFGREPSRTIREDLRRFKQLLETGEIPTATRVE
jgi:uncharacterized membrane protein